jgi:hypothetical protein
MPGQPLPNEDTFPSGGSAPVNDAAYDATFFKDYGVNPFLDTEDDNLSTFAMDVDTASYSVARRFIVDGYQPDPDSVRVEEFINYFDQEYSAPSEDSFAIHIEGAPSPSRSRTRWHRTSTGNWRTNQALPFELFLPILKCGSSA